MKDSWLLPRHQTEYPTRDLVDEGTLHARRESTYLALALLLLVATAALFLAGTNVIDIPKTIASVLPKMHLPVALLLPLGVVPSALGFLAVMLACELYGHRRARALVVAVVMATGALLGLARLADLALDTATLPFALALAAGYTAAHVASLIAFAMMRLRLAGRHFALRALIATLFAQPLGWLVFTTVAAREHFVDVPAIALGSALSSAVCILVAVLPFALAAHLLRVYLRVARRPNTRLPEAVVVDEIELEKSAVPVYVPHPRRPRAERHFSAAEMRFFTEGDRLSDAAIET